MRPHLIPFRAEHLMDLVDRDDQVSYSWDYAVSLERGGPAFTGVVDGKVIACAGVSVLWPGVGSAWVSVGEEGGRKYGLWLTRIVKRVLADIIRTQGLHRVEAQVFTENDRNAAWIEALGFEREWKGEARAFTTDKRDVMRYELLP